MKKLFRIRNIFSLLHCRRGVAATEFAVALPFLMALMLGAVELNRYVTVHEKLEKVAYTISDVVSQSDSVTIAQLNQAVLAAATIMDPYDFSADGKVFVSSVHKETGAQPTVEWQYNDGGSLASESEIGQLNAVAVLPNNLVLSDQDNVIIAEVFYRYEPLIAGGILSSGNILYKVTVFKPRLGALTTPPV